MGRYFSSFFSSNCKYFWVLKCSYLFSKKSVTHIGDIENQHIIAAIDMILYRNPRHPWSFLRAGTIALRYKECTALSSLLHFSQFMVMDVSSAAEWIMHSKAFQQLYNMI